VARRRSGRDLRRSALAGKLFALRAYGALLFLATVAGLRVLGLPSRILAVVALNPAMQLEFVANAHNDMTAIALIVRRVLRRRLPVASVALIAAAGWSRFPTSARLPCSPRFRTSARASRWAADDRCRRRHLLARGRRRISRATTHVAGSPSQDAIHVIAALAALAAIGVALMAARLRAAAWLMPSLGAYIDSWYLMWGFPYALDAARARELRDLVSAGRGARRLTIVQLWTAPSSRRRRGLPVLNRPQRAAET